MKKEELQKILDLHEKWLNSETEGVRADLLGANLRGADLTEADLDYSCWPLWCGSTGVRVDARIFRQLLAHLLAVVVDDPECARIQNLKSIRACAAKSHRAKDLEVAE